MRKIRSQYNFVASEEEGEKDFGISLTVPDQALTVRDLITRYTRGRALPAGRTPIWNGEEEFPDFERMTIQEQLDYKMDLEIYIREKRQELADQKSEEEKIKRLESRAANLKARTDGLEEGAIVNPRSNPDVTDDQLDAFTGETVKEQEAKRKDSKKK